MIKASMAQRSCRGFCDAADKVKRLCRGFITAMPEAVGQETLIRSPPYAFSCRISSWPSLHGMMGSLSVSQEPPRILRSPAPFLVKPFLFFPMDFCAIINHFFTQAIRSPIKSSFIAYLTEIFPALPRKIPQFAPLMKEQSRKGIDTRLLDRAISNLY